MSRKEITLRSAKEILGFFEANPELSFHKMNEIMRTFRDGELWAITLVPVNKENQDFKKPKRQILKWLKENAEAMDNGEIVPCCLFDAFNDESVKNN